MKFIRLLGALVITALSTMAQTGALAPVPIQQPLSNSGLILPGGCLYIFTAGTTTPATTYSDSTLMTPNPNPIVLDAYGRAPAIYMTNSLKMVLANKSLGTCPGSPGTVVWSQDNVYDTGLALRAAFAAASGSSLIGFQRVNGTATTVQAKLSEILSVKDFGAKGDERFVTDAAITAGSATLTSATAAFTTADNLRIASVAMGTRSLVAASYTSGGSISGTVGQTCTLASFNGSGSGATATVALTGANVIAGSTALVIAAHGSGYTSVPTSATLGSGTATCSGTATVVGVLDTAVVSTTMTYVSPAAVTLGATATTTVSSGAANFGTDDSAAILATLAAAYANNGATIEFPTSSPSNTYLMLSQMPIPNNSGSPVPVQPSIKLQGQGSLWDGLGLYPSKAATNLDLRYGGANAKITSYGSGDFTITDINLTDNGKSSTPFILNTNAALHPYRMSITGNPTKGSGTYDQDGIILGGLTATPGSGPNAQFQGYGTSGDTIYFDRIRTGLKLQSAVNSTTWRNIVFGVNNGPGTDKTVPAIMIDGSLGSATPVTGQGDIGNDFFGVLLEATSYQYGVELKDAWANSFYGYYLWDGGLYGFHLTGMSFTSNGNGCYGCGGMSYSSLVLDDTGGANTFTGMLVGPSRAAFITGTAANRFAVGAIGGGANPDDVNSPTIKTQRAYPTSQFNGFTIHSPYPTVGALGGFLVFEGGDFGLLDATGFRSVGNQLQLFHGDPAGVLSAFVVDYVDNAGHHCFGGATGGCSATVSIQDKVSTTVEENLGPSDTVNSVVHTNHGMQVDYGGTLNASELVADMACDVAHRGLHRTFTDSTTSTWGAIVTGGGSTVISAFCNGLNWTVESK